MENDHTEDFPSLVAKAYPALVGINERLDALAREMIAPIRTDPYERGVKYLASQVMSAHAALVLLANNGHGAEAMGVGRGMFEAFLTYRYLILRPQEFRDFIDFDKVARWKRMQQYKRRPSAYSNFSPERIAFIEGEFKAVAKRFTNSKGKVMDHWTRRSISEIADAVGETEMYDVFYRHACSLSHSDPMGLTMLVDGNTFEIPLTSSWEHISIALWFANYIGYRTLFQYDYLLKLGFGEPLREIEIALEKAPVQEGGTPIGWFQHALVTPKESP